MPSFPPEPPEADDDEGPAGRPRALFGVAFWIALLFGVLCVVAGYALARLGPQLFPA